MRPGLALAERLTVGGVTALHRVLSQAVAAGEPILLDGGRVEEIDTAALQLLLSFQLTCAGRALSCGWSSASAALREAAARAGMTELLALVRVP